MTARAIVCITEASPGVITYTEGRPLPQCQDGQTKAPGVWVYADVATVSQVHTAMATSAAAGVVAGLVAGALLKTLFAHQGRAVARACREAPTGPER